MAAIVSVAGIHGFWSLESAVAQNASTSSNMTTGTNMTAGNATMANTSGTSVKMQIEEGIKALQSGDKEGAMTRADRRSASYVRIITRRNNAL